MTSVRMSHLIPARRDQVELDGRWLAQAEVGEDLLDQADDLGERGPWRDELPGFRVDVLYHDQAAGAGRSRSPSR